MAIFGWLMFSLLALFGLGILVVFAIPFVVTECKLMGEKIKRAIKDKEFDLDKRSEERRRRDEIKRERDFELQNKKLDNRLQKVDRQIELYGKKIELAKQLKEQTQTEKGELVKTKSVKPAKPEKKERKNVEKPKEEPVVEPIVEPVVEPTVEDIAEEFTNEAEEQE